MHWLVRRWVGRRHGFTLLEFVIVLLILSIIIAIGVPRYIRTAERSRANEALRLLSELRNAAERYAVQQAPNSYTDMTIAELDFDPATFISGTSSFTYTVEDVTATT